MPIVNVNELINSGWELAGPQDAAAAPSPSVPPPASGTTPFFSTTLPGDLQLDADFAKNRHIGSPVTRLFPVPANLRVSIGASGVTQSTIQTQPVALRAAQAQSTATSAQTTANSAYSVTSTPAISGIASAGGVDLSNSSIVQPKGSLSKFTSPPLSYTSTTNSITITWPSGSISLPDGSTVSISSGSQTISSLASGVSYSFFPYWSTAANSLEWVQASDIVSPKTITGAGFTSALTLGEVTTTTSLTLPTGAYTLECWMYITGLPNGSCTVFSLNANQTGTPSSTTGPAIYAGISGSSLSFSVSSKGPTGGVTAGTGYIFSTNCWHHVVGTYTGSTMSIYVDGVLQTTAPGSTTGSTTLWWWMGDGDYSGKYYEGYMSRCAYYAGTALTAAQVANHYNAMANAGTSAYDTLVSAGGATNFWKLTETSGTTATDSIGSNTGNYTGAYTLNESADISVAQGSPAYAWQNPASEVTMVQFKQSNYPLSAGAYGFTAATTASGTAGGLLGGWAVPGVPYQLYAGA